MKIVHIVRKFLEGFGYQENELVNIHAQMGHEVTVITSDTDDSSLIFDMSLIKKMDSDAQKVTARTYDVIRLPLKRKVNYRLWEFKNLYSILQSLDPDLIFFHGIPVFCLFDITRYKRKYTKVKVAMDCHTDYNNSARSFLTYTLLHKIVYRWVILKTSGQIDRYYYITPNTKRFMHEMYLLPENKLHFLPLGGNLDKIDLSKMQRIRSCIREKLNISEDAIVVVSGGKLDVKKESHRLVEAINHFNHPMVHLILFGSIEKEYELKLTEIIAGNSKIHLIGWIDSTTVYDYFQASDIGCFPGGQSVLWQQAICCGLPLIVRNWQNDSDYLNVADNVLLLNDSNSLSIEKAIRSLVENSALRSEMRQNALRQGRSFFSYQRVAKQIIDDLFAL